MRVLRSSVAEKADTRLLINEAFHLGVAADVLRSGGIVAHATEGVWGLACDPFDAAAVSRLLDLKGRSIRKGLILIGADESDFAPELAALSELDAARVRRTWPGPETWLVPNRQFPSWITGGRPVGRGSRSRSCPGAHAVLRSSAAHSFRRRPIRPGGHLRERNWPCDATSPTKSITCCTVNLAGSAAPSRIRDAVSGARFR